MFGKISGIASKAKTYLAGVGATSVALVTTGLTVSDGAVTFEAADGTALDTGVGNAISNLWAGFSFILPYLGVFLGVSLVVGVIMMKAQRGR